MFLYMIWVFSPRYSLAIVGINLTNMIYQALVNGPLRTHFYNIAEKAPRIQDFHEVYCKYYQIKLLIILGHFISFKISWMNRNHNVFHI